jgi:intracellular sulfur oxidation DsrE/DsrF family protein
MSRIADMVSRGVRITAGPLGETSEIPVDFFDVSELRSLARSENPADVADFAAVYAEAQIPVPFHGYGIDKMVEILESKRLAALPREVRVAAVMASLEAAGVSLPQVIRDAVMRDRALDAFVAAKEREVETLRQRNEARVAALKEELESFVGQRNREIEGLRRASEAATSAFSQLQLRKRQEEERLREVLSHFAGDAENPVPADASRAKSGA